MTTPDAASEATTTPVTALRRGSPTARVRVHSLSTALAAGARAEEPTPASKAKDPFEGRYLGRHGIVEPPHNYEAMTFLLDESDVLQAAVDAMVTNVAEFGVQIVPFSQSIPEASREEAESERRRLEVWFAHAGPPGMNFSAVRARVRFDLELYGDGYYEVLRDRKGRLVGIEHVPTRRLRKTIRDRKPVESDEWIRGEDGTFSKRKAMRRFRKFVQDPGDGVWTWFKEFGDPRRIRADNGEVDESASYDDLANELFCLSHYAADPVYGRPRWRGAANSVKGRASAGSVNVDVFENRAVPPLLITVQGAQLDDGAVAQIRDHFASAKGRDKWHAPLIIEAITEGNSDPADPMGLSRPGAIPRIDVKDLTESTQKDALFMGYRAGCAKDVALSMRLPPIFLGMDASYNFATAQAARQVAEEQVFQPERNREDAVLNALVLPELEARWCKVVTKAAPLLTEEVLLKLIETGVRAGALTVANVADLLEPMLGMKLSTAEKWRALPARVIQSMADKGLLPVEMVKALGDVVKIGGGDTPATEAPPVDGAATNDPAATDAATPATEDGTDDGTATNEPAAAQANTRDGAEAATAPA